MKKNKNINTNLSLIEYMMTVEEISSEYFDDDKYTPQFGMLNAMRLFYNHCYKSSDDSTIEDGMEMENIIVDDMFIEAFNDGLSSYNGIEMNFANAFSQAMDIVEYRKQKNVDFALAIKNAFKELEEFAQATFNEENISKLTNLSKDLDAGKFNTDNIVGKYVNSEQFQNSVKEKTEKIVPINK